MADDAGKIEFRIDTAAGRYPIVYVRGFAPTSGSREETFYDAYYGFAESAVEKRQTAPAGDHAAAASPGYIEPDRFEGMLIRFLKEEGYIDATNHGLELPLRRPRGSTPIEGVNPTQSIWISRFYDADVLMGRSLDIVDHAEALRQLICQRIPDQLKSLQEITGHRVDLGEDDADFKVILIAHSMGGLVCRCLIQNLLPAHGQKAADWIHRFVTIGTPHRGIEMGAVPDFLEEFVSGKLNVLGSAIFQETRMRDYLKLPEPLDLADLNGAFPPERCLCLIGSDFRSYPVLAGLTKDAVGSHSDGLVKQDRAYIKGAYWANVHRAHTGRRGLVNSSESYENIRRFLFGDTKVTIGLENVELGIDAPEKGMSEFYDVEFALSVRGTGTYLHQRKQDPCENALRFTRPSGEKSLLDPKTHQPVTTIALHTGFMDTQLRRRLDPFSHFVLTFRVGQHQVKQGWLWDNDYPERTIYSETLEVRVGNADPASDVVQVQFRWLSETTQASNVASWETATLGNDGTFRLPLRQAETLSGTLAITPGPWRP